MQVAVASRCIMQTAVAVVVAVASRCIMQAAVAVMVAVASRHACRRQ